MALDAPTLRRALPLASALVAALAYLNTLPNRFVFDDLPALLENPMVRGPFDPWRMLHADYWGILRGEAHQNGSFRPLTTAVFWLEWHLGGGRPRAFHVGNLCLHALATGLFTAWFLRALPGIAAPLVAALFFAVHPLHTDAVTGIVGGADLLAFILSLCVWRAHQSDTRAGAALSLVSFAFALLAKESSVPIIALLLIGDVASHRERTPALIARYAGLLGLFATLLLWRSHIFGDPQGFRPDPLSNPLVDAHGLSRWLSVVALFGKGTSLLIAPVDLLPDRGRAVTAPTTTLSGELALGAFALLGLLTAALVSARSGSARARMRIQAAAWWGLKGLLAVHAAVLLPTVFAERLWYLPSAGAAWLLGDAMAWLEHRSPRAPWPVGAALIAVLLGLTLQRNREWRDEESLYSAAVAVAPRSASMQFNLAAVRFDQRRMVEAIARCQIAASVAPGWADPIGCIGLIESSLGRYDKAEAAFRLMLTMPRVHLRWWMRYVDMLESLGRADDARRELTLMRRAGFSQRRIDAAHGGEPRTSGRQGERSE